MVWPVKTRLFAGAIGLLGVCATSEVEAQRICVGATVLRDGALDEDEWIGLTGSLTQNNLAAQCIRVGFHLDLWLRLDDALRRGPGERMLFEVWRESLRRYRQRGVTQVLMHLPPEATGTTWATLQTPAGRAQYLVGLERVLTEFRGLVDLVELPEQPNAQGTGTAPRMSPADYIDLVAGAENVRRRVPFQQPARCGPPQVAAGALLVHYGKVPVAQPGYLYLRAALEAAPANPQWTALRRFGSRVMDHLAVQEYFRVSSQPGVDHGSASLSGVDQFAEELRRYYGPERGEQPRLWITGVGSSTDGSERQYFWQGSYVRNTMRYVMESPECPPVETVTFTEMLDDRDPDGFWGLHRGSRWETAVARHGYTVFANECSLRRPVLSARMTFSDLQGVTLGARHTRHVGLRIWNMGPTDNDPPRWDPSWGLTIAQAEGCPFNAGEINGVRWVAANPPGQMPGLIVGRSLPFRPSPALIATASRTVEIEIEAPSTPGRYLMAAQMYHPDGGFFGNVATLSVTVVADAGPQDSGLIDAAVEDAGVAEVGVAEVGVAEVGVADTGTVDTGVADAPMDLGRVFDAPDLRDGSMAERDATTPADGKVTHDVGADLGSDTVVPRGDAGGGGAADGCGCRAGGPTRSRSGGIVLGMILFVEVLRRRRERHAWDVRVKWSSPGPSPDSGN